jgi:hypothetical protein
MKWAWALLAAYFLGLNVGAALAFWVLLAWRDRLRGKGLAFIFGEGIVNTKKRSRLNPDRF